MARSAEYQQEVDRAMASAREQLRIILANEKYLLRVRNGAKKLADARDFSERLAKGEELTPNGLSYIDGLYEKMFEGSGLPAAKLHIDKKRSTNLRYGGA
jgi:hypothetical protein